MKCYRKNGSDDDQVGDGLSAPDPSMKCYRKNGSDFREDPNDPDSDPLNEVLPKER